MSELLCCTKGGEDADWSLFCAVCGEYIPMQAAYVERGLRCLSVLFICLLLALVPGFSRLSKTEADYRTG